MDKIKHFRSSMLVVVLLGTTWSCLAGRGFSASKRGKLCSNRDDNAWNLT